MDDQTPHFTVPVEVVTFLLRLLAPIHDAEGTNEVQSVRLPTEQEIGRRIISIYAGWNSRGINKGFIDNG